jgi:hypothetical protein
MRQRRNLRASGGCRIQLLATGPLLPRVANTPQPRPDRALCTLKIAGSRARQDFRPSALRKIPDESEGNYPK